MFSFSKHSFIVLKEIITVMKTKVFIISKHDYKRAGGNDSENEGVKRRKAKR